MNYQRAGARVGSALVGVPNPPAEGKTLLFDDGGDGPEGQGRHDGH